MVRDRCITVIEIRIAVVEIVGSIEISIDRGDLTRRGQRGAHRNHTDKDAERIARERGQDAREGRIHDDGSAGREQRLSQARSGARRQGEATLRPRSAICANGQQARADDRDVWPDAERELQIARAEALVVSRHHCDGKGRKGTQRIAHAELDRRGMHRGQLGEARDRQADEQERAECHRRELARDARADEVQRRGDRDGQ